MTGSCMSCGTAVPRGSLRCPGCGLIHIEGEGAEHYAEREQQFRTELEERRAAGNVYGRSAIPGYPGRFAAAFVDNFIIGFFGGAVWFAAGTTITLDSTTESVSHTFLQAALIMLAFQVAYFWVFDTFKGGSPGKLLLGLQVYDRKLEEAVGPGRALVRSVCRVVLLGIPLLNIFFVLPIFFTVERRTTWDIIAGTRVVEE